MTIEQPKIIDFVAFDKENETTLLILVDHLVWDEEEGEHLLLLQEKLNVYLHYVESSQLYDDFPEATGQKIVIRVASTHALSSQAEKFFELARKRIAGLGFELQFEHDPADDNSSRAVAIPRR
jgi:hypothetical protein